jgi:predicted MFS family arabinose efflux permease
VRITPRWATFGMFFVNGAVIGTWVAHIPWLRDRLDVSKGTIGLALLCMAGGALVSLPLAGQLLDRVPSARVTRVAAALYVPLLVLPLLAPSALALAALLALFGAANGAMDVAMNGHGVAVERELGRPIMSSLHAGWSFGGFASAGLAALAGGAGLDPRVESLLVSVLLWLLALWLGTRLGRASAHSEERTGFALPSRGVVLLGILCLLVMVTEGAMGDWSGIYLRQNLGASASAAAAGFTGFSLGMALARVGGDALNRRWGPGALLRAGMALVSVALGGLLAAGDPVIAVIGFTFVGLGIANSVPLLFSAAGRVPPAGPSLAAVFTVGYSGFIAGPPLIGFLADATSLPLALAALVPGTIAVAVLGAHAAARAERMAGAYPARA